MTIRADLKNLDAIYELQELLIAEVTLAEGRVRDSRERAKNDITRRAKFETRTRSFQRSIFFWKAFGDALAFLYCDRFALKHVYYSTHNLNSKQDGGFISGEAGFGDELAALRTFIDAGIPSVLCDLTNTIRYGDLCLLVDNDPILLEVKSSGTRDRRRVRQARRLKTLQEFYETDVSQGLRGFETIMRVETRSEPKSHEDEFNKCIATAYERGYAVTYPESGVCYVAIRDAVELNDVFQDVKLKEPWVFFLNEKKRERAWPPHYPFTLLIRSKRALYDFLLGRLHLVVLIDVAVIADLAYSMGWETVEIDMDEDYSLKVTRNDGEEQSALAQNTLVRAAFEALSLRWLVEEGIGVRLEDM